MTKHFYLQYWGLEMETEWAGVVGVFIGSVTTGLLAFVTIRYQLRHEREKILIESEVAFNRERFNRFSSQKEELFDIIQNLRSGFSLTTNYQMDQVNVSSDEYNQHYEKMNMLGLRAQLLSYLYFPDLIQKVNGICGLTNLIWGQQQNYFIHSKDHKQNRQILLDNIVKYSSDLQNKCLSVMESLGGYKKPGNHRF